MRFGSTAKVLAECKRKYYRISEGRVRPVQVVTSLPAMARVANQSTATSSRMRTSSVRPSGASNKRCLSLHVESDAARITALQLEVQSDPEN